MDNNKFNEESKEELEREIQELKRQKEIRELQRQKEELEKTMFDSVGGSKAAEKDENTKKKVVIDNPLSVLKQCERIKPVRPDKCPPVIPNSDENLREICYETAHKIYGPALPEIVANRLEKELNSIISNGYSVMYIIAQ